DGLAERIRRHSAKSVGAAVFKDQGDGVGQTLLRFVLGSTLPVGSRNLRAVRHEPVAVALDHSGEFVVHAGNSLMGTIAPPPRAVEQRNPSHDCAPERRPCALPPPASPRWGRGACAARAAARTGGSGGPARPARGWASGAGTVLAATSPPRARRASRARAHSALAPQPTPPRARAPPPAARRPRRAAGPRAGAARTRAR